MLELKYFFEQVLLSFSVQLVLTTEVLYNEFRVVMSVHIDPLKLKLAQLRCRSYGSPTLR